MNGTASPRSTTTTRPISRACAGAGVGAVFFGVHVQPTDFAPPLWIPRALECIEPVYEEAR